MLKELEDLGLIEKEARVYMAALEIGKATADQLAKQAKIVRSTTYVQIESLMKKGLMSTFEEGKKTFFAPESPELLRRLLQKQVDEVQSKERGLAALLPDLLRQFEGAGERPVVRYFSDKEGIVAIREEMLKVREKKNYLIFSPEHLTNIFTRQYLDNYSDRRTAAGILSRGIYTHKEHFSRATSGNLTQRRFVSPHTLPLTIDMYIYDDNVAIYPIVGSPFGIVLQSSQIANSMKMIFEMIWNIAKDQE